MLLDRRQLFRQPVDRDPLQRMNVHHAEKVRQPDDVVQMGVGEKDIQFGRFQILARPIGGRPGVQHHAALRQQQARRLPPIVRMVAGRAEEEESHFGG